MKEAMSRGRAVLKANWQCLITGKGEKCNPDKRVALQIIRNFVKGNMKATKEGLGKLLAAHWECWKPIFFGLAEAGVAVAGGLEIVFLLPEMLVVRRPIITYKFGFEPLSKLYKASFQKASNKAESRIEKTIRVLKKVGKCTAVIGLDIAIVVALLFIIFWFEEKSALSKERIDEPVARFAGRTKLLEAIFRQDIPLIEKLLTEGADPNRANGTTPLHYAVNTGRPYIVQLLLGSGAEKDKADELGNTPLHKAAHNNNEKIVKILLDAGANKNAKNRWNVTPLDMADTDEVKALLK